MKGEPGEGGALSASCQVARERLSQFADNEMSGAQATQIAGHLSECAACRFEYLRLNETKAALGAEREITHKDSAAARTRVLARVERIVQQESRPAPSFLSALFGGRMRVGRPVMATCAAAGLLGLAYFILPRLDVVSPVKLETISAALPNTQEIQALYRLHDAHGATTAWDEPVARRDARASAQAELLEVADANTAGSL